MAISLLDGFSRPINYLRISVTDKCNLRCIYCMPEGGLPWLRRDEILTYEEIAAIVRAAASVGVRTIRLTGGEPLLRRDVSRLVAAIAATPGIDDIALSTNGLLLESQLLNLPPPACGADQHLARYAAAGSLPSDRAASRARWGATGDRCCDQRGPGTDQTQLRRHAGKERRRTR